VVAGYQPSGVEPDSYEVTFHEDRAEFARRDGTITTIFDVVSRRRTTPKSAAYLSRMRDPRPGTRAHLLRRAGAGAARRHTTHPSFPNFSCN